MLVYADPRHPQHLCLTQNVALWHRGKNYMWGSSCTTAIYNTEALLLLWICPNPLGHVQGQSQQCFLHISAIPAREGNLRNQQLWWQLFQSLINIMHKVNNFKLLSAKLQVVKLLKACYNQYFIYFLHSKWIVLYLLPFYSHKLM